MVDGFHRVASDPDTTEIRASFRNGIVQLGSLSAPVVATSLYELQELWAELRTPPNSIGDAVGSITTPALAAAGAATMGASVAASSVTVLGSHALGGLALSLGLVSAPVWPVVVAGGAGAALGYVGWKLVKKNLSAASPNRPKHSG